MIDFMYRRRLHFCQFIGWVYVTKEPTFLFNDWVYVTKEPTFMFND